MNKTFQPRRRQLLVGMSAAGLSSIAAPAIAQQRAKIRIGYVDTLAVTGQLWTGVHRGHWAKEGIEFATVIPSDGIGQGVYFQGLVADANHPCAARLWLDHLVSDDVALSRLRAGAIPARYASVRSRLNSSEQTYVPPNTEIEASLAQPDTREALSKLGSEVNFSPLEPFTAFMRAEYAKWVKVTREANIRLDQQ